MIMKNPQRQWGGQESVPTPPDPNDPEHSYWTSPYCDVRIQYHNNSANFGVNKRRRSSCRQETHQRPWRGDKPRETAKMMTHVPHQATSPPAECCHWCDGV